MSAADYESKVPENVRTDNKEKEAKLAAEVESTEQAAADFRALMNEP